MAIKLPGFSDIEGLGDMETRMYLADNHLYIYEPMFEQWIVQDMIEAGLDLEQLTGVNQAGSDPMYYIRLLGEDGAAEASLRKEGNHQIITLTDKDGIMLDKLTIEAMSQLETLLGMPLDGEMQSLFGDISFSDLTFEMWVDEETYYTTKIIMSYKMNMSMEGETITTEQTAIIRYTEFGTFSEIVVPDDVKAGAVSMDELF